MKLADLKIDPDFKNLLPELDDETYTDLTKDIMANGMFDPIITWHGFIADGHNRYEICKAHRIAEVQTMELNKATKSEVMQWIVDHQYARRILLKSEKVKVLLKVEAQIAKEAEQKHVEAMAKAREKRWNEQSTSNLTETDEPDEPKQRAPETAEIMAKKMGVSKNTWKDMKTVVTQGTQKQIKRLDEGGIGNGASTLAREIRMGAKEEERVCSTCGKIKPISEFSKCKKTINMCAECKRKSDKKSVEKKEGLERIANVTECLKQNGNGHNTENQSAISEITFMVNNVKSTIQRLIDTGKKFDAETMIIVNELIDYLKSIKGEGENDLRPE